MITSLIDNLIHTYGYLAVLLLVGLESVGIPLPGESVLIAAALYAGSTHNLNIVVVAAVASSAAVIGDNIGYLLGHSLGERLVARFGKRLHLTAGRLAVGRYLFQRHGSKVVFFGRFVSVLRTCAAFLAGPNRMPWRNFALANTGGAVLWACFYSVGAYYLGASSATFGNITTIAGLAASSAVTIALVIWTRRRWHELEQRIAAAEAPADEASARDQASLTAISTGA